MQPYKRSRNCPSTLRKDAAGNRVVLIAGVVANRKPTAIRLQRVGYVSLLALREVFPRVVAGDGQEVPRPAFKMLEECVARGTTSGLSE